MNLPASASLAGQLPPVEPHVVASAVEELTPRLRKKLDAAIERCAGLAATVSGQTVSISWGEDAVVTLTRGPSGTIADPDAARCGCLLAPRCLHRAAVLSACPVAEAGLPATAEPVADASSGSGAGSGAPLDPVPGRETAQHTTGRAAPKAGPGSRQMAAAAGLWDAATAVLVGGVPGAGAVPQAELLRAAHTARLAGLHRAEAAALRVVRGLRAARARHDGHRLADLVSALRELLLTAGRLAAADPDPALVGTARRAYRQGEALKVYGVCREPVISATGYGGVVTHLVAEDGRWFSVADVRPGGSARARGAATATVALGAAALDHAGLARGGLLISGAEISPEGRLGAGRGVRANPVAGLSWSDSPLAALFARPLAETAGVTFSGDPWDDPQDGGGAGRPVGCDLVIVGAEGDRVLARELTPRAEPGGGAGTSPAPAGRSGADGSLRGPLIRLAPADSHPDLAHVANLRQLASRPGLRVRVIGRLDPDRAATLRPLAIGPVPGAGPTLRLPAEWMDRADLGYDRLRGSHLPSREDCRPREEAAEAGPDPVAATPLWRARRLVELAVSGGRRTVAESARGDSLAQRAALRRAGFETAADLADALTAEADRRTRDVFGRLADSGGDRYAWTWLAAAVHLAATERALVRASWYDARATGERAG
ncbi:hypothetical protein [Streptosporangium amethystogenes]|uniref:hypothetical protein n=1 Tax=Streptosporangium amethystogenes TaxID=2002 RepID=UPI0005616869|nr:hypothetical protein [Streptosporangium amethystogenes]